MKNRLKNREGKMKAVCAEPTVEYRELRKDVRYLLTVPVKTEEGNGLNEFVLNYSSGGCCISSPVIFQAGDFFILYFPQLVENQYVVLRSYRLCKVVWNRIGQDRQNEYGIQFLD
jgi:hypothetical protein